MRRSIAVAGADVVLDVSESTRREPAEGLPLFGSDRLARVHAARWLEKHGFGTGNPFRLRNGLEFTFLLPNPSKKLDDLNRELVFFGRNKWKILQEWRPW